MHSSTKSKTTWCTWIFSVFVVLAVCTGLLAYIFLDNPIEIFSQDLIRTLDGNELINFNQASSRTLHTTDGINFHKAFVDIDVIKFISKFKNFPETHKRIYACLRNVCAF